MKKSRSRTAAFALAVATIGSFAWCPRAHAAAAVVVRGTDAAHPPDDPNMRVQARDRPADESAPKPLRIGVIGGVGFPRPLAVEGMVLISDFVALGAEYGVLPATTIGGVQASLWSLAGDARVFPFHGAFFVGVRAGHQHVGASTTIAIGSLGSAPEDLTVDSWFLNPRIGFLWTSRAGLAFGVEAGVQFPLSSSVSSTLPLMLVPSAQRTADALGSTVVPTIDLFRLGLLL